MEHPYPKGTIVRKINSVAGEDTHQDGALAEVVGHIGPSEDGLFGYFVLWNDLQGGNFKGLHVFIGSSRVEAIEDAL